MEHFRDRTGDMRQFCGLRRSWLADGKAGGVEAVDLWTMAGLRATVLPGRGMDIDQMSYRGIPLAYQAKAGVTAPGYYDPAGMGWLRSFFGGMLTTCGIANAGPPGEGLHPVNGPVQWGQHGRISNAAADDVGTYQRWEDETYRLTVSGRVREAAMFAENYCLRRTVETDLRAKSLHLTDVVTNESDQEQPVMLLYHINLGYPMLDEGTRVHVTAARTAPISPEAVRHPADWPTISAPIPGYTEALYFHDARPGPSGRATACLVNDELHLAWYVRFDPRELPCLTQWKMMGRGEYVLGLEPGNCFPVGRRRAHDEGTLAMLPPWGTKHVSLEIGVADGAEEIAALLADVD